MTHLATPRDAYCTLHAERALEAAGFTTSQCRETGQYYLSSAGENHYNEAHDAAGERFDTALALWRKTEAETPHDPEWPEGRSDAAYGALYFAGYADDGLADRIGEVVASEAVALRVAA